MIQTMENHKFNSFIEISGYLKHITLVKLLPLFFLLFGFCKAISNLTSVGKNIIYVLNLYGVDVNFLMHSKSFFWLLVIPIALFYLVYAKPAPFFKHFYIFNILSVFAIITFFLWELKDKKVDPDKKFKWTELIRPVFMEKDYDVKKISTYLNWEKIPTIFFYMGATTSMKGEVYGIYKGLTVKNPSFMKKFIQFSLIICWIIYPIYGGLGYFVFRDYDDIKNAKNFVEAY